MLTKLDSYKKRADVRWSMLTEVLEEMNAAEIRNVYYHLVSKYGRELNSETADSNGRYLSDTRDIT